MPVPVNIRAMTSRASRSRYLFLQQTFLFRHRDEVGRLRMRVKALFAQNALKRASLTACSLIELAAGHSFQSVLHCPRLRAAANAAVYLHCVSR